MITTLQSVLTQVTGRSQFGSSDPTTATAESNPSTENPDRPTERASDSDQLRVLSLSADPTATFYEQKISILEECGVECTTISPPPYEHGNDRSPWQYLRVWVEMLREISDQYDIIHANYGLVGPIALAQPKRPVVMTLWGSDLMGKYGAVSKLCARYCDAVIVMSDEMAELLGSDCHVVPHGIDLGVFRPIPVDEARGELGWDDDTYHVLFPYSPERDVKNYPRAQRVVKRVRKRVDRPVELKIASGIDHHQMPHFFNAADTLLLTSKREGSPNTVKEAMACNLPVVSTDVGDVRDRVDGVAHSAVGSTDERLTDHVVDVLRTGQRSDGRKKMRSFSAQRRGERIRALYEDLLDD